MVLAGSIIKTSVQCPVFVAVYQVSLNTFVHDHLVSYILLDSLDINIILDEIKIDPFESAFGIRSGLNDVKVNGPIKQGICSSFKIQQKINVPLMRIDQTLTLLNRVEIWLNRPKPSLVSFRMKNDENTEQVYMSKSNIVIIISIIYLSIVMICVAIYLRKIEKRYRLLKFQGETPFFHKNQVKIEKNYM